MATTRRALLQGFGAGLAGAMLPRTAAANFTNTCSFNVLQIFLQRALSHRDTLWVDEDAKGWAPHRLPPDLSDFAPAAVRTKYLDEGDVAGLDHDVYWGEGLHPLVQAGVIDNSRLIAMRSETGAHTLASAYALMGSLAGRPEASGLGARVQHLAGDTPVPVSWVLDAGRIGRMTQMAAATGHLPAETRPFVIPVGDDAFVDHLYRGPTVGDPTGRQRMDPIVDLFRDRYRDMLAHDDGPVRSAAFELYSDSANRLIDWDAVQGLLDAGPSLDPSGNSYTDNNMIRGVAFGAHLLANGARHVSVVGGISAYPELDTHDLVPGDGGGLDYTIHATRHNGVLWGVCEALRQAIALGTLDLSTTLVVIHTEFGRFHDGFNGSEHRPEGYAALAFGASITGRNLAGRLSFQSSDNGVADGSYVTPPELHNAMTVLAGADATPYGVVSESALASKVFGTSCNLPWSG